MYLSDQVSSTGALLIAVHRKKGFKITKFRLVISSYDYSFVTNLERSENAVTVNKPSYSKLIGK